MTKRKPTPFRVRTVCLSRTTFASERRGLESNPSGVLIETTVVLLLVGVGSGSTLVEEMVCAATGQLNQNSTVATATRRITALNDEIQRAVKLTEIDSIEIYERCEVSSIYN